jgi:hypothetical protein
MRRVQVARATRVVDLAEQHDEARLEGQAIGDRIRCVQGLRAFPR